MASVLTQTGRAIITDRLNGAGGAEPVFISWGTGAGTAAFTDTTLFTEASSTSNNGTGRTRCLWNIYPANYYNY